MVEGKNFTAHSRAIRQTLRSANCGYVHPVDRETKMKPNAIDLLIYAILQEYFASEHSIRIYSLSSKTRIRLRPIRLASYKARSACWTNAAASISVPCNRLIPMLRVRGRF